jgi:hypothetical protein
MRTQRFGEQRRPIAIWLALGLLLAAAVAWMLLNLFAGERSTTASASNGESMPAAVLGDTIAGAPQLVNEYLLFVALHQGTAHANRSHDYTADGLRRLAAALSAVLQFEPETGASQRMQVESLYRRADDLRRDSTSLEHAELARGAFTTAEQVSRWLQERNAPAAALQLDELRTAASDIDPTVPLLQQISKVERCFDRAGAVLRSLTPRRDVNGGSAV